MTRLSAYLIVLACIAIGACGGNGAVPDVADAMDAPTACQCPTEALTAERIVRDSGTISALGGASHECPDAMKLLAGSCVRDTLEPEMALYRSGFFQSTLTDDSWGCSWRNPRAELTPLTVTVVCLEEADPLPAPPEGCDCLPPQPIAERIIRVEQIGSLEPMSLAMVSSRCDPGDLVIGGSCVSPPAGSRAPFLFSAGFTSDDAWQCAWNNPNDTGYTVSATAICLQPPAPDTAPDPEPMADRIVRKVHVTDLPSTNAHLQDVTCDAGDFLLWGSCALENPSPALADVTFFRSGFLDPAQDRPNTWQCAWNNPTDQTPVAIATAVCLKPPASP